jgi:hypothetical protein
VRPPDASEAAQPCEDLDILEQRPGGEAPDPFEIVAAHEERGLAELGPA